MDRFRVSLVVPPGPLWQNRRHHWVKSREAARLYRYAAFCKASSALDRQPAPKWHKAVCHVAFYWPDSTRRDPFNALAALKPGIDGLVDAGILIDDDKLLPGMVTVAIDKRSPRVDLCIEPDT